MQRITIFTHESARRATSNRRETPFYLTLRKDSELVPQVGFKTGNLRRLFLG